MLHIMQGYGTMALEALDVLPELPTHVFLQAGVGSMAAAVLAILRGQFPAASPAFALCEARAADCFYRTAAQRGEEPFQVSGSLHTIMAGLACGEANPLAWPLLRNYCNLFLSLQDEVSAYGMRLASNPLTGDPRFTAGESGAAGLGALALLCSDKKFKEPRERFKLNKNAVVLLFNTEGATDEKQYRRIVWNGEYPLTGGLYAEKGL
jgi:diaminopropionate ammonia-lyase